MTLEFNCQKCQARLRIPDEAIGKQIRCPACATVSVATAENVAAAPTAAFVPPSPATAPVVPPMPLEENPYLPSNTSLQNPFEGGSMPAGQTQLTPRAIEALAGTRPWVLFLAILGLLGTTIYALGGLAFIGLAAAGQGEKLPAGIGMVVGSLIMFFPSWFLLQFGRGIGRFLQSYDVVGLENAMLAQRSYWRLLSIMVLVGISLSFLLPCFAGMFAAINAAHH